MLDLSRSRGPKQEREQDARYTRVVGPQVSKRTTGRRTLNEDYVRLRVRTFGDWGTRGRNVVATPTSELPVQLRREPLEGHTSSFRDGTELLRDRPHKEVSSEVKSTLLFIFVDDGHLRFSRPYDHEEPVTSVIW